MLALTLVAGLTGCATIPDIWDFEGKAEYWVFTRPGVAHEQLAEDRKACHAYAMRWRVAMPDDPVRQYRGEFAPCMIGKGYTEQAREKGFTTAPTAETEPTKVPSPPPPAACIPIPTNIGKLCQP